MGWNVPSVARIENSVSPLFTKIVPSTPAAVSPTPGISARLKSVTACSNASPASSTWIVATAKPDVPSPGT
jgi:hypothetical protein